MSPPYWRRGLLVVGLLLVAGPARATGVYFGTEAVLKAFFPKSERVSYVQVVTHDHAAELRRRLGYVPPRARYTVFVARSGERVDGYAVVDDELGQHLPITFGIQTSARGVLERSEVMAYHEHYGEEIRDARYRQQFVGREADSVDDVVAVSGATISSRSMAVAVRRALALVHLVRQAP